MESIMVSPNKLMGMLVYRTREALDKNTTFKAALNGYEFYDDCFANGKFMLWHYPVTPAEATSALTVTDGNQTRIKCPAILNLQPVKQEYKDRHMTLYYTLAITGYIRSDWTSKEREESVFELLLRPVYHELMKQIANCGYFRQGYGDPLHIRYDVFTTGGNMTELEQKYGDTVDVIELHKLALSPRTNLCSKDIAVIENDNNSVIQHISNN